MSPERFFIAHMQKTAGTSLRDRFRNHFPLSAIYPNGSEGRDLRVSVISVKRLLAHWDACGDEIRLLTGHFPLHVLDLIDADFVTLTVLREPVDRTLSYLRHQKRINDVDRDLSLEELYDDPFRFKGLIENHMVRTLSLQPDEFLPSDGVLAEVPYDEERLEMAKEGLRSLDAFGLQDRFEEFCTELSQRYELNLGEPVRSNTTEHEPASEALIERIRVDSALDVQLYDYACQLYEERRVR